MSVLRQQNWLGQQRVDIPHLRAIESSICADFDVLAGRMLAGLTPVVIQGFETITTGMTGQPATNLQINVANSTVMHPLATESGTIFWVPTNRPVETLNAANSRVHGGFTANAVNYIGIDLLRTADATTSDLVQFLNPQTDLETPKSVPLGRTLDYVIYISTQDFSSTPGLCPIAIVTTDSSNNIVSGGIVDARSMMFRLGAGGSVPNATYTFPWGGGRTEVGNNTDFAVGDKVLTSFKSWANAVMTRLWELGGGSYWYTPTNVFNIELARTGSPFVSNGQYFEWDGNNLHWKGLVVLFDNTVGWNNTITDQTVDSPGLTNLADGDCLYVDLVRGSNATVNAAKGTLATLGTPAVPGSRVVIAWRKGTQIFTRNSDFAVNTAFSVATTSAVGVVKLQVTPGAPSAPVVFNPDANGKLTVTQTGGAGPATTSTGFGITSGIKGTGGASDGWGVEGVAGGNNGVGVHGAGVGTGGIGVVGIGSGSGTGGEFYGGASGIALRGNGGGGNNAPTIEAADSLGQHRFQVDSFGFNVNPNISRFEENWSQEINYFINPVALTVISQPSTSQSSKLWDKWFIPAVTNFMNISIITTGIGPLRSSCFAQIGSGANPGANADFSMRTGSLGVFQSASSFVADFMFSVTNNASDYNFLVGFRNGATSGVHSTEDACMLEVRTADYTKLYLYTNNGGASGTSTVTTAAIPFGANNAVHVRLELHGSASAFGSAVARMYVNGALAVSTTTTLPRTNQNALNFCISARTPAGVTVNTCQVGPLTIVWNRDAAGFSF